MNRHRPITRCPDATPHRGAGFTLLELLLALALTVLLFIAISMAVHLNLHILDSRRTRVEETQVARAVMRMIADDLRSSVMYHKSDFSSAQQTTSDSASALLGSGGGTNSNGAGGNNAGGNNAGGTGKAGGGATGGNASSGGNTNAGGKSGTGAGGMSSTSSAGSGTQNTENIEQSESPPDIPGLYGNESAIQIDLSRLPRLDEYSSLTTGAPTGVIPSDVKTVCYYVRTQSTNQANLGLEAVAPGLSNSATGLVRREWPRAITRYAVNNGDVSRLENTATVIAPEVTNVQFRYFSGQEWLPQWDSEQMQGLPLAVEILVTIRSARNARPDATGFTDASAPREPDLMYRMVVRIPVARIPSADETSSSDSSSPSSSSPSSSSNSASGGSTR